MRERRRDGGVDLREAVKDVSWFYGSAEAQLGRHGTMGSEGGGYSPWDEERSNREHARMGSLTTQAHVAKYRRIAPLVAALSEWDQALLAAAYGGGGRPDYITWVAFVDGRSGLSVLGVALLTTRLAMAFQAREKRRTKKGGAPREWSLQAALAMLDEDVRASVKSAERRTAEARKRGKDILSEPTYPAYFAEVRAEANELLRGALTRYEARRNPKEEEAA